MTRRSKPKEEDNAVVKAEDKNVKAKDEDEGPMMPCSSARRTSRATACLVQPSEAVLERSPVGGISTGSMPKQDRHCGGAAVRASTRWRRDLSTRLTEQVESAFERNRIGAFGPRGVDLRKDVDNGGRTSKRRSFDARVARGSSYGNG